MTDELTPVAEDVPETYVGVSGLTGQGATTAGFGGQLWNGDFRLPPGDTAANIHDETNPLPGWFLVYVSGTGVTVKAEASAFAASGHVIRFSAVSGALADETYIEQTIWGVGEVPFSTSKMGTLNAIRARSGGAGGTSAFLFYLAAQYVKADGTAVGSASGDIDLDGIDDWYTALAGNNGTPPALAAGLRVRVGMRRTGVATATAQSQLIQVAAHPFSMLSYLPDDVLPDLHEPLRRIYSAGALTEYINGVQGFFAETIAGYAFNLDVTAPNLPPGYEVGTFTPVLTFATMGNLARTYSAQLGEYQKVGNRCHFSFSITTATFTHTTASGNLEITGLPFTSEAAQGFQTAMLAGYTKANYTHVGAFTPASSTLVRIQGGGSGQALANITAADMPTGGTVAIRVAGSYKVS